MLLFRGERIRVSPIANLVHAEVFFFSFLFSLYVRDRENGSRASFSSKEKLCRSYVLYRALQTFRWERVRVFLGIHNGRVSILRKGQRSVVGRLSFVRHYSRDSCRPSIRTFRIFLSHYILYHSEIIDLDVTSSRRNAKALRSLREEITNLTRIKRRRILKSELLHRYENLLRSAKHASNNSKALRMFKCLLFRCSRNVSTIDCSITKCIQIKCNTLQYTTHTFTYTQIYHQYTLAQPTRRLCK